MKSFSIYILIIFSCGYLLAQSQSEVANLKNNINKNIAVYGEKHLVVLNSYNDLLKFLYENGEYKAFIKASKNYIKFYIEVFGGNHQKTADLYNYTGLAYKNIGKYNKAIKYLEKALSIYLKIFGEQHLTTAGTFNNLGLLYYATDNYDYAIEFHKKASTIYQKIFNKKHNLVAETYNNLGTVYFAVDEYSKALKHYKKALKIFEEILEQKHPALAKCYNKLGEVYSVTGDYFNANQYFRKALTINSEVLGTKHAATAQTFNNLGNLYKTIGDFNKSITYFQNALGIFMELNEEPKSSTALTCNNLGEVHHLNNNFFTAIQYYIKSLELKKQIFGKRHSTVATTYNNLGQLYLAESDFHMATHYFEKALEIRLKVFGEKHSATAIVYNNLGEVYLAKDAADKASGYFQKALRYFDKKHAHVIKTQTNLAYAYENSKKYSLANALWNSIIPDTQKQLRDNYLFLTETQKMTYLNTINNRFINFFHFMSRHGNEDTKLQGANLLLNSRAQILDYSISTRKLIENIEDEQLDSLVLHLSIVNKKIAKAELLTKEELKKKGWNLEALRLLQNSYREKISLHPAINSKLKPAEFSWQGLQESLNEGEALLDYFNFFDKTDSCWVYQALIIKKNEPRPIFIPLTTTRPVDSLLQITERFPHYLHYKASRQKLHNLIWQSLEPHFFKVTTIHIVPIAGLSKIDFESLQNERGNYLGDIYNFKYYTSFKHYFTKGRSWLKKRNTTATLYGDISYYEDKDQNIDYEAAFEKKLKRDTLTHLPATLKEIKTIEKIGLKNKIASTLLTNNEATEDTIEYFSGQRAPDIIHFATHGAYLEALNKKEQTISSLTGQERFRRADNPLQRSMLMLSNAGETWHNSNTNITSGNDGILTALEVTNLDLSKTNLVVLSACNSGIGSQHTTEGVFGLPRAFKLAGVNKILVSLWPVEDETTKELMILFYTNLLKKKNSAAIALRKAKKEMRKRNNIPKKWAGFILIE